MTRTRTLLGYFTESRYFISRVIKKRGEKEGERKRERNTQPLKIASNSESRRFREMFPHLCVQNDGDVASPDLCHGGDGGVCAERRRAVGWWWWRALIIPRHAIAIRELPNQPRVWLGRQWCSIIRFACRVPHIHAHIHRRDIYTIHIHAYNTNFSLQQE